MADKYESINWKVRSDPDEGRAHVGVYGDDTVVLRLEDQDSSGSLSLDGYELDRFIRKLKKARRTMRRLAEEPDPPEVFR